MDRGDDASISIYKALLVGRPLTLKHRHRAFRIFHRIRGIVLLGSIDPTLAVYSSVFRRLCVPLLVEIRLPARRRRRNGDRGRREYKCVSWGRPVLGGRARRQALGIAQRRNMSPEAPSIPMRMRAREPVKKDPFPGGNKTEPAAILSE